eukprot:403338589
MNQTNPLSFSQFKNPITQKKQETYQSQDIQKQIQKIIQSANDDIKDIQITKSSGMLVGEFKQQLLDQMKNNLIALEKLEKLSKNPFLHNDFLYNRVMKSTINYYKRAVQKGLNMLKDKIEWIESQYFHWLTKLIKILQYFQQNDLLQMKQEVANVFNWFQNFTKYIEGMKLLEYPRFFKGRKKSTELLELDKLSSHYLSVTKPREKETDDEQVIKIEINNNRALSNAGVFSSTTDPTSQFNLNFGVRTDLSTTNAKNRMVGQNFPKKLSKKLQLEQNNANGNFNSMINVEPLTTKNKIDETHLLQKYNQTDEFQIQGTKKKTAEKDSSMDHLKTPEKNSHSNFNFDNQLNTPYRVLPKIEKREKNQKVESLPLLSNHSSIIGASDTDSVQNNSVSGSESEEIDLKKPENLRKKYLIEAPLSFKMNPPPKIVDLTSDFFEKDTDQLKNQMPFAQSMSKQFSQTTHNSPRKQTISGNNVNQRYQNRPPVRLIINNPRQNTLMVEQGKKKIGQLKNFYGKMISDVLMREFEMMFAPLDENQENGEYGDLGQNMNKSMAQTVINQTQGVMPPGMVHDDVLNSQRQQDGLNRNGGFEFKQSGIGMIRRTAQDDYRFQQLNEISDLKNLLVKKGINLNHKVLQRAILMPEDQVFDGADKNYPRPSDGLMKNPFPRKNIAKKKKKKRRVVPRLSQSMMVERI